RKERNQLARDCVDAGIGNAIAGNRIADHGVAFPARGEGIINDSDAPRAESLGEVAHALKSRRHVQCSNSAVAAARAFIADKEDSPVAPDRTANSPAEYVVAQRWALLLAVDYRRKEIGRVELLVAEIFEQRSLDAVRSGLGVCHDHAAGRRSEFGG